MKLLQKKICIVTGAGQGLGEAVAKELASEGAKVVLLERNQETLDAVVSEIMGAGGEAQGYHLDVTDYARYAEIVSETIDTHGAIHALINNAAITPPTKSILEDSLEDWRQTIAVNLESAYMGSKLVARHMIKARSGRIIHIASVQGFVASGEVGAYNAAKGGLIALTKSMAVELGAYDILVNAVAPGFMQTPMSIVDGVNDAETPEFMDWYVGQGKIPLLRTGYPEDVSGTVVFLASEYCRYMTGQLLIVDGGLTSTF